MTATRTTNTQRLERLRTLTVVSRALTYATSIEEVLHLAVQRAAELMGAEKALIMLTDSEGLLTVRAAHGVDQRAIEELREPLDETLIRRLQDLLDYPTEDCFLSVPLVAQGEVTGLLAAVRPLPAASAEAEPTEDEEWLLSALADQVAVALENARLVKAARAEHSERTQVVEAQGRTHAMLSHELRSPLAAIEAYSALLLDGVLGPLGDRQRESVSRIRTSGKHLLSIIENVLDVARINAGVMTVSIETVHVSDVVTEAVKMLQPLAAQKRQELRSGAAEELAVRADPDRLRQALLNLIGNAIKYTPDQGTIQVEVSATERAGEPSAAIAVTDDGPGMPAGVLATVFKPYHRGPTAGSEAGLGLGLFIAREAIRQMGGEIEARSELGAGSTFTVFLPLSLDGAPTPE